jgi:cyclopropane-fatty-acyl-phospholipid synthase
MLTKKILNAVFKRVEGQKFEIEYWDGESRLFNPELKTDSAFKIIFADKLSLNEIRKSPQLKLAEAYMEGKINFEGDIKNLSPLKKRRRELENIMTWVMTSLSSGRMRP